MIAIIGGYGEIGIHTTRILSQWGKVPLKVGGRNPKKAQLEYQNEFSNVSWVQLDASVDHEVLDFIKGAQIVVSCIGPSYKVSARLAKLALQNKSHFIDAGTDEKIQELQTDTNTIVYAAGTTPGLTGILPVWFSQEFDKVTDLIMYTGALGRFSKSGAEDYLVGVLGDKSEPSAALRNGRKESGVLKRSRNVELPFFPRPVTVYPFFDEESTLVAEKLQLKNAEWYLAIDGKHSNEALNIVRSEFKTEPKKAIDRLCRSADFDLMGKTPYCRIIMQMSGIVAGNNRTKTIVVKAKDMSLLTGAVTAFTCQLAFDNELEKGVFTLPELAGAYTLIELLGNTTGIEINQIESSIEELLQPVEGEI